MEEKTALGSLSVSPRFHARTTGLMQRTALAYVPTHIFTERAGNCIEMFGHGCEAVIVCPNLPMGTQNKKKCYGGRPLTFVSGHYFSVKNWL